jgi:hypothetical protein
MKKKKKKEKRKKEKEKYFFYNGRSNPVVRNGAVNVTGSSRG